MDTLWIIAQVLFAYVIFLGCLLGFYQCGFIPLIEQYWYIRSVIGSVILVFSFCFVCMLIGQNHFFNYLLTKYNYWLFVCGFALSLLPVLRKTWVLLLGLGTIGAVMWFWILATTVPPTVY